MIIGSGSHLLTYTGGSHLAKGPLAERLDDLDLIVLAVLLGDDGVDGATYRLDHLDVIWGEGEVQGVSLG